jgi:hypothetical protein
MGFKKVDLYRGFNIYVEEVRPGTWGFAAVEIPSSEATGSIRPPSQGRVPGGFQSKDSAIAAARVHIDRINKNRKNRAAQQAE